MIGNDLAAGLTRFVLAGLLRSAEEREPIVATLDMPLRVVRLAVPIE